MDQSKKKKNVAILIRHANPKSILKSNNLYLKFEPNGILNNMSQEEIFTKIIGESLLEKLYDGLNLIVLSFGCNDTGKIHTMFGQNSRNEFKGIVPRMLENIFKCKEEHTQTKEFKISLVVIEIRGKDVFNLLKRGKPRCHIHVKPVTVNNLDKALSYVFNGGAHRPEETYNPDGTIVFTINVECSYRQMNHPVKKISKIHFAVMPGNGDVRGSNILKLEQEGNSVKSQLSTICSWSRDTLNEGIPNWRSSKLFTYLGQSLSSSYIRFLGHIQYTTSAIMSTISTLKFAYKLMRYPNPSMLEVIPVTRNKNVYIRELKEEIETLKEIQIMKEITNGNCKLELISMNDKKEAASLVNLFLHSCTADSELVRECHPMLFLYNFKQIYTKMSKELQEKVSVVSEQLAEIQMYTKKKRAVVSDKYSVNISIYSTASKVKKKKKRLEAASNENQRKYSQNELKEGGTHSSVCVNEETEKYYQEQIEISHNNYKKIFQEFLNRNPHLRSRLNAYEEVVSEYLRVRSNIIEDINKIKIELNCIAEEEKLLVENNQFLTNQKYKYTLPSLEEKRGLYENRRSFLKQKLEECSLKALSDNTKYIERCQALNECVRDVESEFNDYVLQMYTPFFIIDLFEEGKNDTLNN